MKTITLFLFILLAGLPMVVPAQSAGPLVGTVKPTEARFLYRPGASEVLLRLSVLDASQQVVGSSETTSLAANDYVAQFHVTGLQANTRYQYKIDDRTNPTPVTLVEASPDREFKTTTPTGTPGVVTTAFLSCANNTSEGVNERMGLLGIDYLFLMGDTPYIDTSDLAVIRQKHRDYLRTPFLASLIARTPTVGVWDDHDFGLNNGNGVSFAAGKPNTLKAFVEYRAHDQYGTGTEGVYHKVDLGVMEVFMLDPRWFSQTAASPVDPTQKTCFGSAQWQWLLDALKNSRAPFKVIGFGEVWQDKKNTETDDMFTYWYERDALLDYIRDQKIPGVVLQGGDIHLSRHLIHPQRLGYDLHDFITSPAHTSTIASLDVPHPDLEWSLIEPNQFLTLTADTRVNPPVLTARYMRADGSIAREVVIPYTQLVPKQGSDLGDGLRAWWNFDDSLANQSVLGSRVNATSVNGAALVADAGLRGGAVTLSRAASQYLLVPNSSLDDNAAAHTVSMWCKPATLPAHGSLDRAFLMESTLYNTVSGDAGYTLSIGFRAAENTLNPTDPTLPGKINLELYTNTLKPAVSTSTAPTTFPQGPFACQLDRSLFTNRWAHVAVAFSSTHLRLYVDGIERAAHVLPTPGPSAEFRGLVIGGHRAGTGRNFDGMIDEVALWNRALTPADITSLYSDGTPDALPITVAVADTDNDSMPDWWENDHGLAAANPADALDDSDGDGVPAWLELSGGTSPLANDLARYNALRLAAGEDPALPDLAFRNPVDNSVTIRLGLQSSDSLGSWDPVPGPASSPESTALRLTLPATTAPAMFYRFSIQP